MLVVAEQQQWVGWWIYQIRCNLVLLTAPSLAVPLCIPACRLVPPSHLHQLQQRLSEVPSGYEGHVSRSVLAATLCILCINLPHQLLEKAWGTLAKATRRPQQWAANSVAGKDHYAGMTGAQLHGFVAKIPSLALQRTRNTLKSTAGLRCGT